jgi:rubrerythrin
MALNLDFAKLSGTDVLDMAIAIESEAELYYEQLADWVTDGDPKVRDFFLRMAKLERHHHDQIVVQRKRLYGNAPKSNADKVSWAVEMPDFDKLPTDASLRHAFDIALDSENRAFEFYSGALDYVSDEQIEKLFKDLSAAEAQHTRMIRDEMQRTFA